jgi:large subunit ribosomal protein L17
MRHRKKSEKFSRSRAQRKALVKSLVRAIIINERITTTESKAKGIRPWLDKLITWSKTDTLHHRRLAFQMLGDHLLVRRLFESIGPRYKTTPGGYTRIFDLGFRKGDNAKVSIMELTKIEKKDKVVRQKKEKEAPEAEHVHEVQPAVEEKQNAPKKGIFGMRSMFKKERHTP